MRALPLSDNGAIFLTRSEGILRKLATHPRTAHLIPIVQTAHDRLQTAYDAWLATHDEILRTQAELESAETHQDEKVGLAAFTLLGKVDDDRRSPLWISHFPRGYRGIAEVPAGEEELDAVALAEIFARDEDPDLRALGPVLALAAERARDALEAHREAVLEESAAYGALQLAKLAWNEACHRLGAELRRVFGNQTALSDRFFEERAKRRPSGRNGGAGRADGSDRGAGGGLHGVREPHRGNGGDGGGHDGHNGGNGGSYGGGNGGNGGGNGGSGGSHDGSHSGSHGGNNGGGHGRPQGDDGSGGNGDGAHGGGTRRAASAGPDPSIHDAALPLVASGHGQVAGATGDHGRAVLASRRGASAAHGPDARG